MIFKHCSWDDAEKCTGLVKGVDGLLTQKGMDQLAYKEEVDDGKSGKRTKTYHDEDMGELQKLFEAGKLEKLEVCYEDKSGNATTAEFEPKELKWGSCLHEYAAAGNALIIRQKFAHRPAVGDHITCWHNTALHWAAMYADPEDAVQVLLALLDCGVNPDVRDLYDDTAFETACQSGIGADNEFNVILMSKMKDSLAILKIGIKYNQFDILTLWLNKDGPFEGRDCELDKEGELEKLFADSDAIESLVLEHDLVAVAPVLVAAILNKAWVKRREANHACHLCRIMYEFNTSVRDVTNHMAIDFHEEKDPHRFWRKRCEADEKLMQKPFPKCSLRYKWGTKGESMGEWYFLDTLLNLLDLLNPWCDRPLALRVVKEKTTWKPVVAYGSLIKTKALWSFFEEVKAHLHDSSLGTRTDRNPVFKTQVRSGCPYV